MSYLDHEGLQVFKGENDAAYGSVGALTNLNNGYQDSMLNAAFYDGYYSGTPAAYKGTGAEGKTSGWGVAVVPVPAGKQVTISGFRANSGTNTVWLNSSDPTDINSTAWNSGQNNGTKTCKTGWLGISDYNLAGNTNTIRVNYALLDNIKSDIAENESQISKTNNALDGELDGVANYSTQFLQSENATSGYYYTLSNGVLIKGGGGTSTNAIYDKIPVKANHTYYYKNLYAYFCYLDDGGILTQLSSSSSTAVSGTFTPTNDGYVYITTANAATQPRILTDAKYSPLVGESTKKYNVSLAADGYIHLSIGSVATDYDYTNPIAAVRDITDSSATKQYMLDIYPGTYDLQDVISSTEQTGSIWGLKLPDYVHMRGIGERDDIVINCALPDSSESTAVEYTSTLNLSSNNSLENLTFTGTNVRYVVHDESNNTVQNWKRVVKNCKFIHYGNAEGFWAYTAAWGEGCSSGSYSYFEDCVFENYMNYEPFGFHTNESFDSACTHIFKNCKFVQHYSGSNYRGSFMIDDIQCGKPINVEFVGCYFSRFIYVQNHSSSTDIYELNITGHSNSPALMHVYRPNVSSPKRLFTKFSDEVAIVNNPYSEIAAGKPLKYASYINNTVGVEQSNGTVVAGIALDTIPQNGVGYMKYAGILDLSTVGVTGITYGSKVGVASYSLAAVTDGTDFARAIQNNTIKFN